MIFYCLDQSGALRPTFPFQHCHKWGWKSCSLAELVFIQRVYSASFKACPSHHARKVTESLSTFSNNVSFVFYGLIGSCWTMGKQSAAMVHLPDQGFSLGGTAECLHLSLPDKINWFKCVHYFTADWPLQQMSDSCSCLAMFVAVISSVTNKQYPPHSQGLDLAPWFQHVWKWQLLFVPQGYISFQTSALWK